MLTCSQGFNYPDEGATKGATPADLVKLGKPWVIDYKKVQVECMISCVTKLCLIGYNA